MVIYKANVMLEKKLKPLKWEENPSQQAVAVAHCFSKLFSLSRPLWCSIDTAA